jgi:YD repeat-containing protein
MTLYSTQNYEWADLILPDGGRIHYVRTSAGTGFLDAEYEHTTTPSPFYQSHLLWNQADLGWNLTLKDGTVYVFGDNAPLREIRDRFGNTLRVEHNGPLGLGNVTKVLSPHNRWIALTYDGSDRVTEAKDNLWRTVGYTYYARSGLPGALTSATYDDANQIATFGGTSLRMTTTAI